MGNKKLVDIAKTIRSKNAGVDKYTFDIIFTDKKDYETVKKSGVLTKERVAKLFNVSPERITDFVNFDPANAIKFTMLRSIPSGSPGDPDILGCQQYAPLMAIEVPWNEG